MSEISGESGSTNLSTIIESDSKRYINKGYGLFWACILALTYIVLLPYLVKTYLWQQLIDNFTKDELLYYGIYGIHIGGTVLINAILGVIYYIKHPFFEKYRIQPNTPWSWEEKDWDTVKWRIYNNKFKTSFIIYPASIVVSYFTDQNLFRYDLETFPSPFELIRQLIFFMIIEDFFFYWGHRILHQPYFYKKIHKIHHEFKQPVGITAEYSHPVEEIFTAIIPSALGFKMLKTHCHVYTIWAWILIRVSEAADGHCGYEFSWTPYRLLPMSGSAIAHNFHHTHNSGNYGTFFTIWDKIMGTDTSFNEYLNKYNQQQALNKLRGEFNLKKKN